jgi:hypothetical protein
MADVASTIALWFERGLQFHKLSLKDTSSRDSLGDSFQCYGVGLAFSFAVFAVVFLLRTSAKLDVGQFAGLPVSCLIEITNTAVFIGLLYCFLRLLRVRAKLRDVTVVCCYAIGGLLPVLSVCIGYFLYSAIGLAVEHGDPGQRYLRAAIYRSLLSQEETAWVRFLLCALALTVVAVTVTYLVNIVKVLTRTLDLSNPMIAAVSTVLALYLDGMLSTRILSMVFWKFVIQQAAAHHV